jgi:demethylmenaquinone methyltransferase/2-methoxy-6-polyprenyl-1,4-benzoquinol methylase
MNDDNIKSTDTTHTTHFGYKTVDTTAKADEVSKVFHSVAHKYDVMNDVMSAGLHRIWKAYTIHLAGVRLGMKVLDIAGGTGDLAGAFAKQVGETGVVWHTDINPSMLKVGRDRMVNAGYSLPTAVADGEHLPFQDNVFDVITVAFGLRNMTDKTAALHSMLRVLKPGGKLMVLEFSKVNPRLQKIYDIYSFKVLPWLGQKIAGDAASYQYLAESIRMHPDQDTLKAMIEQVGFTHVQVHNMTGGVVALHTASKL